MSDISTPVIRTYRIQEHYIGKRLTPPYIKKYNTHVPKAVASEAHKKWGGSATSLAIELTSFLANSGAAKAASAAAAPTPM